MGFSERARLWRDTLARASGLSRSVGERFPDAVERGLAIGEAFDRRDTR